MYWFPSLLKIEKTLAELYPGKDDPIRLLETANVPHERIKFNDTAIDNWHNILKSVVNRGLLPAFLAVCIPDSGSLDLKATYDEYVVEIQQAPSFAHFVRLAGVPWPLVGLALFSFAMLALVILLMLGVIGPHQRSSDLAPGSQSKLEPVGAEREPAQTKIVLKKRALFPFNLLAPAYFEQKSQVTSFYQLMQRECNGDSKCRVYIIQSELMADAVGFTWVLTRSSNDVTGKGFRVSRNGQIADLPNVGDATTARLKIPDSIAGDRLVAVLKMQCKSSCSEEDFCPTFNSEVGGE
jgi:hypothetical protein